MFETMGQRMGEAGARVAKADSETLWAMVEEMANNHESPLAASILQIGKMERWTTLHTALALAYAHMVLSNGHAQDMKELIATMNRPIVIAVEGE